MEKKTLAIVIVVYNIADLITKQIECIRKYCKDDDYDIIVVENSDIKDITVAVEYYIKDLGCRYIKTQASDSYCSLSHAFACNVSYFKIKEDYDLLFYLDHDNFPIKPFSVSSILETKIIAGLGQSVNGFDYFWTGCVMFNNSAIDHSIVDFSTSSTLKLDTGGMLYRIIEKYGKDNCTFFDERYYQNAHYSGGTYNYYATINNDMFMHFVNSSGWNKVEDNKGRISSLLYILGERIG